MFTKHAAAMVATVVLSSGAVYAQDPAAPPAQPPTVNQRLESQNDRIQKRRARAIHIKELKDRQANGGTLTDQEKAELNRALNRHSRRIARERRNDTTPKP